MKILILNSAKSWGGNELWSKTLANGLADKGHSVFFAARTDIFDDRLSDKVELVKFPFRNEMCIRTHRGIRKLIKTNDIQILLPTKRKEYFIAGYTGRRFNLPVCFRLGIKRRIPIWDFPQRFVYQKLPDGIIVNAHIIKDILVSTKIIKEEKIRVIYNGYDFPEQPKPFDEYEIKKDKFVFATAGRLSQQKGYDILLRTVKKLKNKNDNFYVYLAGSGSEEDLYKHFVHDYNLEDTVFFTGYLQNVRGFFSQADAVVIPSRNEGIPNALFEAWSVKKPVISSNADGLPEVMRSYENGIMTPLRINQLSQAMEYIINNPETAKEFGEKGHNTLNNEFTLDVMLSRAEKYLTELINNK